jgi:transposase
VNKDADGSTAHDALQHALERLRAAGGDGRALGHDHLAVIRHHAVARMRQGSRPADLAAEYGLARATLYRWRERGKAGDHELEARPGGRTPYKMLPESRRVLREALLADPRRLGLGRPLWSRSLVARFLREQARVVLSGKHLRVLLRQLGLWPASGLPTYAEQCAKVPEWLAEEFGRVRARAEAQAAPLFFLQIMPLPGELQLMSIVRTNGTQRSFAVLPADNALDDVHGEFLDRVLATRTGPIFLITDPLIAPSTRAVAAAARRRSSRLTLVHLPAPRDPGFRAALRQSALTEHRAVHARLRANLDGVCDESAALALDGPRLHQPVLSALLDVVDRRRQAQNLRERYGKLRKAAETIAADSRQTARQVRAELNQLIAACRHGDNKIGITQLTAATGMTRNTINLVARRATEPTPSLLQSHTSPAEAINRVSRTASQWRELSRQCEADLQLVACVSDLFDKAAAVERQTGADRDQAIMVCHQAGLSVRDIAEHAGLSESMIYALIGPTTPGRHGQDPLLARLGEVAARWRFARDQTGRARRRRNEQEELRRQAIATETSCRMQRNRLIELCASSGYTIAEIAAWSGMDVATATGSLSAPQRQVTFEQGQQALQKLRTAVEQLQEASWEVDRQRLQCERLEAERRSYAQAENALRRQRDQVLLMCRAGGATIATLAAVVQVDAHTIREALRAANEDDEAEEDALFASR